nr:MAG TPA: hypothetical protein [Caudoviricetes sp.]
MSLQVRSYSRKTHLLSSPLRHVSGPSPLPYSRRVGPRSQLRGRQIIVGRTSARPRTLIGKRSLLSRTAATFPLLSQGYRHWWLSSQLTVSNTLEVRRSHLLTQVARRRLRGIVTLWRKWLSRRTERRLRLALQRRLSRMLENLYPALFSWPPQGMCSATMSSPVGTSDLTLRRSAELRTTSTDSSTLTAMHLSMSSIPDSDSLQSPLESSSDGLSPTPSVSSLDHSSIQRETLF